MRYYYETIREPSCSGDERRRGVTNPGVWHVYNPNKSEPVAVCRDRADAETIVRLFNEMRD